MTDYQRPDATTMLREAIAQETSWADSLDKQVEGALDRITKLRAEAAECRANAKRLQESLDKLTV